MIQCELCKSMIQKAENMRAMTDSKYWHYPSCTSEEAPECKNCGEVFVEGERIRIDTFGGHWHYDKCPSKEAKEDKVDHPSHYNQGGVECIDALAAATANLKGIEAFDTANAIKYLWRWKEKNGVEDLEKAIWYINHIIDRLKS